MLRNALMRFRRLTPGRFVADKRRARALVQGSALPQRAAAKTCAVRLVVTLTTIPERIGALGPVLRSLLDQTVPADRIILWRPERSRRTGQPYPPAVGLPAGIEVLSCTDEGPATKLLPALVAEPDAALVVVDDDVIYPHDFLETLLAAHRADSSAAIGWRGWRIVAGRRPKRFPHIFATALSRPEPVDILLGTWGYLVPPGSFDEAVHDLAGAPEECRFVDDVWLSGHLARRGVRRMVVPGGGLPIETSTSAIASLGFGANSSGANDLAAIRHFAKWW